VKEVVLATSPRGTITLADKKGSFDLGDFDVFDIIDLSVHSLLCSFETRADCTYRSKSSLAYEKTCGCTSTAPKRARRSVFSSRFRSTAIRTRRGIVSR
jgi:hypothetical protein